MNPERPAQTNADPAVVDDFGREWEAYNHRGVDAGELTSAFADYFHIFPFETLPPGASGFDMGCGSGRWAKLVAPRVGTLRCVDASELALVQARANLGQFNNCTFECSSVADSSIPEASQDFGYCLGVLHHIPDTAEGLRSCTRKLKQGAPFLLYLYYRFDNRPGWFRAIWHVSDVIRNGVSRLPFPIKLRVTQAIALLVYLPLAKLSLVLEKLGVAVANFPLSSYRDKSFYFMRTDALDRFGTKLEQRFTRAEMQAMMTEAGLKDIRFSERMPHWVAVGYKR